MGNLAVDLGVRHREGSARGERSQLSALGVTRLRLIEEVGVAVDRLIRSHRESLEQRCRSVALRDPSQAHHAFQLSRSPADSKVRWVDGTPENSFYIHALQCMFPRARFIHIVRNVDEVVRSFMYFEHAEAAGVSCEDDAYDYWLRTVRACCIAEHALGPGVISRVLYSELVGNPNETIRRILRFLGEPFFQACVEPTTVRINASKMPSDAKLRTGQSEIAEAAHRLSERLERKEEVADLLSGCTGVAEAYEERVDYCANFEHMLNQRTSWALRLDKELTERTEWCLRLEEELACCRVHTASLQEEIR